MDVVLPIHMGFYRRRRAHVTRSSTKDEQLDSLRLIYEQRQLGVGVGVCTKATLPLHLRLNWRRAKPASMSLLEKS